MHIGHIYHLEKTKINTNCDGIICIMSGNFVQRGEPAIIDKWLRTKEALLNGVDLVIELPCLYSVSSSEFFSYGAVSLLNNLKIVKQLSFGSESGNIDKLFFLAKILVEEPEDFKISLKKHLSLGLTFPEARNKALVHYFSNINYKIDTEELNETLKSSNNILAIEYCKSLIKLNSAISPITFKRLGNNYNEEKITTAFPSATAIRNIMKESGDINILENFISKTNYELLSKLKRNNYDFAYSSKMFKYIKYKGLLNIGELEKIPDASEGIHNKVYKALLASNSFDELMSNIKSKRYSYTRLSRILCQYFIGFENFNTLSLRKKECPYGRILGMNENGKKILNTIKRSCDFTLYTKLPNENNMCDTLKLELQATKAYSLLNSNVDPLDDFYKSPIIL